MINGAHTSVIPQIPPLCTCWPFEEAAVWQGSRVKGLDVCAAYVHCTNNKCKVGIM